MREARLGRFAEQGISDAQGKAESRVDAQNKAGKMREARHGRCARQDRADARGKVGQMRGTRQGRYAIQGRVDAQGKADALYKSR
jgi:hypothetical protein